MVLVEKEIFSEAKGKAWRAKIGIFCVINGFCICRTNGKTVFLGLMHVAFSRSSFLAIVQNLCNLCRNSSSRGRCRRVGGKALDRLKRALILVGKVAFRRCMRRLSWVRVPFIVR